jgi:hypothetical protein
MQTPIKPVVASPQSVAIFSSTQLWEEGPTLRSSWERPCPTGPVSNPFNASWNIYRAVVTTCFNVKQHDTWAVKCIQSVQFAEKDSYRILMAKLQGKRPLGRPRRRWVNNIKMDLREICSLSLWVSELMSNQPARWTSYVYGLLVLGTISDYFTKHH